MNKIKHFFGRLFATRAYLATLSEKQLLTAALSKSDLYDAAYARGRLAELEATHRLLIALATPKS